MLVMVRELLGEDQKRLYKPLLLLGLDSLFTMVTYGMLYLVIIDILSGSLTLGKIMNYTLYMVLANIIRLLLNTIGYAGIQIGGARSVESLRTRLGDHIRNINLGFFNKNSVGRLTNIMLSDIADFEMVLTHSTSDLIKTTLLAIYLIGLSFTVSVPLAMVLLLIILIALPIMIYGGNKVKKAGEIKKNAVNHVISRMIEYLSGIQVFKNYNMAGERFKRLEQSLQDFKRESIRTEVSIVPYVLIFQVIIDLSFPILLLMAMFQFTSGALTKEATLTFIIINMALTNVLRAFAAQYGMFRYFKLSCEKLIEVKRTQTMPYSMENLDLKHYDIELKDVYFGYEPTQPVLKGLSFTAKSGQMTALIGHSGSGKTTVTSLIARFWDVNSGVIQIGGVDLRHIKPDALLEKISMVFQEVYLLNDTLYNNIRLGSPHAKAEEVVRAARLANCHEFIMKLENQYDTMVGEGGSTLSGGEKQRISIARALLKDAPIILLDEATASLDADNEYEIRQSIETLTKNKTVIVIAHRLNTIKDAGQIVVLENGRVAESGTHESLVKSKGLYAHLYEEMERAKEWII